MDNRFIALYDFHGMFFHWVGKLSFSNKFLSDQWLPYVSINMISTLSWCESKDFHVVDYMTRLRLSLMFFPANKRRVHSFEPLSNLAANTQCSLDFVKFIVNICEQTTNFFSLTKVLFGLLIFFPKSCLKLGVRLIHKCSLYTSLYGNCYKVLRLFAG